MSRSKSRSPAPPSRVPHSPPFRPFLPPSHYAAAAGLQYPPTSPRLPNTGEYPTTTPVPLSPVLQPLHPSSPTTNLTSTFSSRVKRQSNLGSIPQLEAHLLPSLKDTIDRMTKLPTRRPSSTITPPTALEPPTTTYRSPPTPSRSTKPPAPHPPTSLPQAFQKSLPVPKPPSSPRPAADSFTKPRPKSVLKSALRPPTTFKHLTPNLDAYPPSPSSPSGIPSRSAKAIMDASRKISSLTPTNFTRAGHMPAHNETPSGRLPSKNFKGSDKSTHPYTGRARSKTDPGTVFQSHVPPLPVTTPQPPPTMYNRKYRLTPAFFLDNGGGYTKVADDDTGESELEYQYELDARDKRRLVVMNAHVVPSSSESEVETRMMGMDSATGSPILAERRGYGRPLKEWKNAIGLGLGFEDAGVNRSRAVKGLGHQGRTEDEDTQAYHDQDLDKASNSVIFSTSSRSSIDMLSEIHRKRRDALLGIVNGLGLGFEPAEEDAQVCEESDFCLVQEGLAISGSGDIAANEGEDVNVRQEDMSDEESVYALEDACGGEVACVFEEAEGCGNDRVQGSDLDPPPPTFLLSTEVNGDERGYVNTRSRGAYTSESPRQHPEVLSSSPDEARERKEGGSEATGNKGRKAPSRSPVVRHSMGVSMPAPLRRYSVYESHRTKPPTPDSCAEEKANAGAFIHESDDLGLSESPYAAAARERKAFGIPPSVSDEMFQLGEKEWSMRMPRVESDLSSVGSTLWLEDCDELSVGAEALLRSLSGKADRRSYQPVDVESDQTRRGDASLFRDENITRRSSSISQNSSSTAYENRSTDLPRQERESDLPDFSLDDKTWQSNFPPSLYGQLLEQYGETEMRRQEVIWELCVKEEIFVDRLDAMVRLFVIPLRVQNTRTWISGIPSEVARFFDWLEDIVVLHKQILSALHTVRAEQAPVSKCVAESIRRYVARFEVYQPYIVKLEEVAETVKQLIQDPDSDFGEFVKIQQRSPDCRGWSLEMFLVEPRNRLTAYPECFRQLGEFTPKNHPDFLPTFSLLHTMDVVIRVLTEVKTREDEYDLVKSISAHIQGLSSSVQLARRERRLLVHGLLQCVESGDNQGEFSGFGSSIPRPSLSHLHPNGRKDEQRRSIRLLDAINDWNVHRGRSGSIKSVASSATGVSFRSHTFNSSASSGFPIPLPLDGFSSYGGAVSPFPNPMLDRRCAELSLCSRPNEPSFALTSEANDIDVVHAFVFTDLTLFTKAITSNQTDRGDPNWCLLEDIGLSRILGITNLPQTSVSAPSILLNLLPVDASSLDTGVIPGNSCPKTFRFSIPEDTFSTSLSHAKRMNGATDVRQEWLSAFERCFQFTLRSLSFPSHSGGCLAPYGPSVDLELDTQHSVLSILASGLPLPKSPSIQLDESVHGPASDARQLEREQRGWWSLRFQQVLRELQRQDWTYAHGGSTLPLG